MKYAKFAVIVFVLYFLGYVLGPSITPILVKDQTGASELVKQVTIRGGATYTINLADYRTDDLPKTVKIKKPVELTTKSGEGVKALSVGSEVKLLNRDGTSLKIETTDGIAEGLVSIDSTELFEALAQAKFDKEAGKVAGGTPTPNPPTPTPPTPPVQPKPPVVANTDNTNNNPPVDPPTPPANTGNGEAMANNPENGNTTEPEPGPDKPAPTPDLGDKKLTADEIVALMKKFIAGGSLKEFKAEQVQSWKAGEDESIDGVSYQIGEVTYMAKTIFGDKPVGAKALIKGGEIDRWVFAKSGMEMR